MKNGQFIEYVREDSGAVLDRGAQLDDGTTLHRGFNLTPGEPILVGDGGLPIGFAERLIEEGLCILIEEPEAVQPAPQANEDPSKTPDNPGTNPTKETASGDTLKPKK